MLNSIISKSLLLIVIFFSTNLLAKDSLFVEIKNLPPPYSDYDGNLGLSKITLNNILPSLNKKVSILDENSFPKADLFGLSIKDSIKYSKFIFTDPIYKSNYILVSNKKKSIKEIDQISDSKIGFIEGSGFEKNIKDNYLFYDEYNTAKNAFFALLNKQVNYLIVDKVVALHFLSLDLLRDQLFIVKTDLGNIKYGFYVTRNDITLVDDINSAISNFKSTDHYKSLQSKYFHQQTNNYWLWILAAIVLVMLLIIGVFLLRKKNILKKISDYNRLNLNGLIIFRLSPTYKGNDQDDGTNFKESLNDLQAKYNMLNFSYDYGGNSVKLKIDTPKRIFISEKEFLNKLTESLDSVLKQLPENKYIIDINISGEFSNIEETRNFLIVNKKNEVGLHIDNKRKSFIPNLKS